MNILQVIGAVDKIIDAIRALTIAVKELTEEMKSRKANDDRNAGG